MTKGRYTPVSSSTTGTQPYWRPTTWTATDLTARGRITTTTRVKKTGTKP